MAEGRTILLADVPAVTESRLRASLPDAEFRPVSSHAPRDRTREVGAGAAVVWLNGDPEPAFRLVHALDGAGVRVVVVGERKDADLILRAMRQGAKEFVVSSDDAALARALREQARPASAAASGVILATFGAKGGVGATTVATSVATALQARGERTCLVDLNLNMGDVLAFLDLPGGYSISDVMSNMKRLDRELLDASLLAHGSGVHVVAQSHRIEDSERVTPDGLSGVLHFLRQHYGAVVLDGIRNFDDLALAALDAADRILLLVTQEVPSVRDARRCAELLRRVGNDEKLLLVVNRYQKGQQIDVDVIAENVGVPVGATLSNDYASVMRAVNRGVTILDEAPRSPLSRDVRALAARVAAGAEESSGGKRSILKRLFGRGNDGAQ
jgi:pilus assembly protein CpaE